MLSTPLFLTFCYTEPDTRSVNCMSLSSKSSIETNHICALTTGMLMLITKTERHFHMNATSVVFCLLSWTLLLFVLSQVGVTYLHARCPFTRHFSSFRRFSPFSTRLKETHAYDTQKPKYFTGFQKQKFISGGSRYGQSVSSKYALRGIRIIISKCLNQRLF